MPLASAPVPNSHSGLPSTPQFGFGRTAAALANTPKNPRPAGEARPLG